MGNLRGGGRILLVGCGRERSGRKVYRMSPRFLVQPTEKTELVTEVESKKGPHLGA